MTRVVTVGAAQLGPVARDETRKEVVERLLALLHAGARGGLRARRLPGAGAHHVLPHVWYVRDQDEVDAWFEREMPSPATQPLFDAAAGLGSASASGSPS